MARKKNGRRNHRKRSKFSHRSGNTQNEGSSCGSDVMGDIEAQLEVQRRKRSTVADEPKGHEEAKSPPPKLLGNLRFDPERNAYFPKKPFDNKRRNRQEQAGKQLHSSHASSLSVGLALGRQPLAPFFVKTSMIRPALECCTCPKQRRDLGTLWESRLLANGLQVQPSMLRQYDRVRRTEGAWVSMLAPLLPSFPDRHSDGDESSAPAFPGPRDLQSKSLLHPSVQTFDVHMQRGHSFPSIVTHSGRSFYLRYGRKGPPKVWKERVAPRNGDYSPDSPIRWIESTGLEPVAFVPTFGERPIVVTSCNSWDNCATGTKLTLSSYRQPFGGFSCRLRSRIHNLTMGRSRPGVVGIAPERDAHQPNSALPLPVAFDLERRVPIRLVSGKTLPSDALCVEFVGEGMPDCLVMGHRCGTITAYDLRQEKRIWMAPPQRRGSVHSLLSLRTRPMQMIHQVSFGSVGLTDLRALGGSEFLSHRRQLIMQPVSNDQVQLNETLSSCCTGLAVDPTESVVLSPFADEDRQTHLGIWSVQSGHYITSKRLAGKPSGGAQRGVGAGAMMLPHCELNRTITPAWHLSSNPSDGNVKATKQNSSWGLWFKSGMVLGVEGGGSGIPSATPKSLGSIHQVTFPVGSHHDFSATRSRMEDDPVIGRIVCVD